MPASEDAKGFTDRQIAQVAHDISASFKRAQGERDSPFWHQLSEGAWQREDSLRQVRLLRENPAYSEKQDHEAWMKRRLADGWTYGPTRDYATRKNPLLVPWESLPFAYRARARIGFHAIRIMLGSE